MTSPLRTLRSTFFAAAALALFAARFAFGDEAGLPVVAPPAEAKIDFGAQVLPLLRTNCLACHSASVKEGDLSLESPEAMRTGGTSGPAIVPGKGEESLLFRVAAHRDEPAMPPADNDVGAKNLSPQQLGLLRAWIDQGAEGSATGSMGPIAWQALDASFGPIYAADISADGRYAAAARGNRALLFDLVSKREIGRLVDPALASSDLYKGAQVADLDAVQSLAFSRDGLRIATGGFRTVRLWKREEGAVVRELGAGEIDLAAGQVAAPPEFVASYGPAVEGLSLPTDANLAVFAGIDGTARLWNLTAKAQVREFGHGSPLTSLALRRDGKRLATAAIDGSIVIWDVDSGARIAEASRDSSRKLREAELRHAIEVARLRERTAKSDLDAAIKREREEAVVADVAELFAAETRLAAKRKATEAEKPVAEKDAAEKALAEAEAALVAADAAKQAAEKNRITASEALVEAKKQRDAETADEAAVKAAEETEKAAVESEKQAVTALAEATKKRDDAKREAERLRPIAQKAIDERTVAEGGAKTAEREAGVAKEVVAKTLASLPAVENEWKSRIDARRADESALAGFLAESDANRERTYERNRAATALREMETLKTALAAAPPSAPAPTPESLAAKEKAAGDLGAANVVSEERLNAVWGANAMKRATFDGMLGAKRAAEETLNRANEILQAATSRKQAADKALADAKAKLEGAANDEEKELRALGVTIAERNVAAAAEALAGATAAKSDAEAKKTEHDKAAETSNADAMRAVEEASKALADARTANDAARAAAFAAEEAAGGPQAVLTLRERLLSEARVALAKERPSIRDVAFSQEGDRLAAIDEAGNVRVFGSETGELLTEFSLGAEKPPVALAFDGEGRLAIASSDGTTRLHESFPVWRLERTIGDPASNAAFVDRVTAIEFDPTGTLLATGGGEASRSGELKLWNVETGELVRDFAGAHSDTVFDVAFSSDGAALASCGADRFVKTFDAKTGELLRSLEGHTHHVLSVDWRADDRLLATGSADQTIKVWDVRLGEQIRTIQGLTKETPSLRFLGASDEFAVAVGDAQVGIRNVGGGSGATFLTPEDFAFVVRASADGQRVLAGGQDGTLRIWDRAAKPIAEFAPAKAATP